MSHHRAIHGPITPERLRRALAVVARCAQKDPRYRPIFKVLDEALREAEMAMISTVPQRHQKVG